METLSISPVLWIAEHLSVDFTAQHWTESAWVRGAPLEVGTSGKNDIIAERNLVAHIAIVVLAR